MASTVTLVIGTGILCLFTLLHPVIPLSVAVVALHCLRLYVKSGHPTARRPPGTPRICFFHPFTNDGGGGERVLWCMVKAMQEEATVLHSWVVYTGDAETPESLSTRAKQLFGVDLPQPLKVVRLHTRSWVEASSWPRFTLLGQSFGSVVLVAEALIRCTPSVFVDTAGYAFAYPVAKLLAGCPVVCYTHYPTISTDMLCRVQQRTALYNNSSAITESAVLSSLKLAYYRAFALLYGLAGACADVAMVNSSWTEGHIRRLWRWSRPGDIHRVYPPCNTAALQEFPLERQRTGKRYILSIAQFRPEKNHVRQLQAFAQALEEANRNSSTYSATGVAPGNGGSKDSGSDSEPGADCQRARGEESVTGDASGCDASATPVPGECRATGAADSPAGSAGSSTTGDASGPPPADLAGAPAVAKASSRGWLGAARSLLGLSASQNTPASGPVKMEEDLGVQEPRGMDGVQLKLVGGCRHADDEARIELLAALAENLGISSRVDFCVNVPFTELQALLRGATCGLHTMLDEHFGISVVEYMAAGAIAIAHNSGGPKADILQPVEAEDGRMLPVGFLASTTDEYAAVIQAVFSMPRHEHLAMAARARSRAASYSDAHFAERVRMLLKPLLSPSIT